MQRWKTAFMDLDFSSDWKELAKLAGFKIEELID